MSGPIQKTKVGGTKRGLFRLWTIGAGLLGVGAGYLVLSLENGQVNDGPGNAQEVFIFLQAALLLGVIAGALSPTPWVGRRRSAVWAALLGAVLLFILVSVRVVQAGNGTGFFFGCLTLPFLIVSLLGGVFGSWIGALLADIRRGGE